MGACRGARVDAQREIARREKRLFECLSSSLRAARKMVLAVDLDLLNPPADYEKQKHKLKRLVQSPNSFFMDVKCQVRLTELRCCLGAAAGDPVPRE